MLKVGNVEMHGCALIFLAKFIMFHFTSYEKIHMVQLYLEQELQMQENRMGTRRRFTIEGRRLNWNCAQCLGE